ncbi:haloacid dehalogenase type II [Mangrovibacillus cuniculi]|uniref:Haloacid dehalogenase type II n=1 Tax=Mangrovibacillus cuniculi TaxID=2593652 RepID=A0A7S8CD78_9BACI|nr:haloacid dehalogenase type II [Mangrovibacillus cuniculi]QPC47829.1 haloacid dehalogenase type II [Mangrovibacillus cuniculi]
MQSTIKAFVFDVYGTLFDVHSIQQVANEIFPGKGTEISQTWRQKQIEYSFLRQLMGQYKSFKQVTKDALVYSLTLHDQKVDDESVKRLIDQYLHLDLYPEVIDVLTTKGDQKLAVFSNGSRDMLEPLLDNAKVNSFFDHIISVDDIKNYKPTPASYMHALNHLGFNREEVLFMSSNGWDITGAKSFGFHTAWINRGQLPVEVLQLHPDNEWESLVPLKEMLTA